MRPGTSTRAVGNRRDHSRLCDYVKAHGNLGLAYSKKGQYDAAIASHKEVIRLKPLDAWAHYHLGIDYLNAGNRGKALEEYKILKELDPDKAKKLFDKLYETPKPVSSAEEAERYYNEGIGTTRSRKPST